MTSSLVCGTGIHHTTVTVSAGISVFPEHATDLDELMRFADSAMYTSKQRGRDCAATYAA